MKKIVIGCMFLLVCVCFSSNAFAFKNGDFQLWNTESVDVKLNKAWKASAEEELRFGNDLSELYYTHTDGGLTYKVTDGLVFGLNYRLIYEKDGSKWKPENRPHGNIIVDWKWQDLQFNDRSRFELRIRDGKDDKWRYRNKLTVKFPWKWTDFEIQPYIADEIFVDFHGTRLNRNRAYVGIGAKLVENLKLDIFYLWQTSKESPDKWANYNVLGIKVKAVF